MTLKNWMNDIPQQFLNKKNIEVLIKAFARQMDELYQVHEDLRLSTTLEKATGQSLLYIGDILSTSLKEAQEILMLADNTEITDERYRKVLQYKTLQNNCECTYDDIMESISLLWNTDNIRYKEDPEHPATIYIVLPEVDVDGIDPAVGRVLAIKPAGISVIYAVAYHTKVNIAEKEKITLPKVIVTAPLSVNETGTVPEMKIQTEINNKEIVAASMITLSKNIWYLDGSKLLDGSMTLDAEKTEEVL